MNEALSFLGLLFRGSQIIIGLEVSNAIKRGKIKGVLLANNISEGSLKEIGPLINEYKLPSVSFGDKISIGTSIGKKEITMIGFLSKKAYLTFVEKAERSKA